MRPDYRSLRFEEDWSVLADARCPAEPLDHLKYMALGDSPERYVTLGGEARWRYEWVRNGAFGSDPQDSNGYFLKRYLLHGDIHPTERLRFFVQLQAANESGRMGGPRAEDEDDLDFNQAFVDWTAYRSGDDLVTLRAGRHELEFGASRLLSAREGLNTRQSFDGVRLTGRLHGWGFNATTNQTVNVLPGTLDNFSSQRNKYAGTSAWTANPLLPGAMVTIFSNYRRSENAEFDIGRGVDRRYTTGIRSSGRVGDFDHSWETGVQRGQFQSARIRAWYFASDTGYTLSDKRLTPRLGLRFDVTSGDHDRNDNELGTFSPLFSTTAYSGLAGQIGPSNVLDVAPSISLWPNERLQLNAGVIGFWRVSLEDGIYTTTGSLRRPGNQSDARFVGTQSTLQMIYNATQYWTFVATASYFDAGRFLKETPPGENVTYFTAWATFRF